ncbi:glutathione S-transferase family protein [Ciceribacter sp. L1K22]|uniref:glutathione S-transferase family protein n=1 Tax=Ciceribacter sp. L1K22 TaxID=2820275 RepID=UPI001ABEAC65|nr:glutathione S-transferase family protein [Ciceribacter sp. L1K22]MBO3760651.1 glutathione S-transferase family protein [Ciceribacter sp. L1K22]
MSEIVFYTNPMSRGRMVRWMLEEVGVPYRAEIVPFGPPMKTPDYRSVNPLGKVPSIRHGDNVVTEVAAICAYLADAFPEAHLAPPPADRASYYRWIFFAAGPLEACLVNRALGVTVPDDKRGMVGYGRYETMLDTLEAAVSASDYVAGKAFTAADVYVGSHIGWGMHTGAIEKRQAFTDYLGRVGSRPAARRAAELDDAAAAAMQNT